MDIETRTYLKKMIEDAGKSQLIMSVLQRFANQMSAAEVEALQAACAIYLQEAQNYLQIDEEGKLVVTDPDEIKKLGLEVPQAEAPAEGTPEEDEEPAAVPAVKPTGKPQKGNAKKDGYT